MARYQLSYTLPDRPNHWLYEKVIAKDEAAAKERVSGAKYFVVCRIPSHKEFRRYIRE